MKDCIFKIIPFIHLMLFLHTRASDEINKPSILSCKIVISMKANCELHACVIGILLCILVVEFTKHSPKCQDVL